MAAKQKTRSDHPLLHVLCCRVNHGMLLGLFYDTYAIAEDLPAIKCGVCQALVGYLHEKVTEMREEAPFSKVRSKEEGWGSADREG